MKRICALALILALLTGCGPVSADEEDNDLHILCTTYPVYLLTTSVIQDIPGIKVELLVNQQTSCLHDYTLTVKDMRAIDRADIIVMNGAGLEEFMTDALAQSNAQVIDCSEGVDLLPSLEDGDHYQGHGDHDDGEEYDPHYWMDPRRAAGMMEHISNQLSELDPGHSKSYEFNYMAAYDQLGGSRQDIDVAEYQVYTATGQLSLADVCSTTDLVTFHDGFQYFADAFGLTILKSIEEEEGAEASAKELEEITALVKERQIPAIFVEKNGSRRSADVIARETGCQVYELDLMMSGDKAGVTDYLERMEQNLKTVREALG